MPHDVTVQLQPSAIPTNLLTKARRHGIALDLDDLLILIGSAVPYTHAYFNRRAKDVVFRINRQRLVDLHVIECKVCDDSKLVPVEQTCERCSGHGCAVCRQGTVRTKQPCSAC